MINKKLQEIIVTALTIILICILAVNSILFFSRIDLTKNKIFSISKISRELFKELPEQVSITYYVTDKLREYSPIPEEIEDMLFEYAAYSRGKIRVTVLDPAKEGIADEIVQKGVVSQPIQILEENQQSIAQMFSGISIDYLDQNKILPFVLDIESLEYELTSAIRGLVKNETRKIGILLGYSDRTLTTEYSTLQKGLSQYFEVTEIVKGEEIPGDLSCLFVVGNRDLDEVDLFPVDQYIMTGGRVLFLAQGVEVDLSNNFQATKIDDAPLLSMLESYGADVSSDLVLDVYHRTVPFSEGRNNTRFTQYPHWVQIHQDFVSKDNPVTSRFAGLDLVWPDRIDLIERTGVEAEVLLQSTPQAWLMDEPMNTHPFQVQLYGQSGGQTGQYNFAVALSGTFSSHFKARPIPSREGEEPRWTNKISDGVMSRIIVISDADFVIENLINFAIPGNIIEFLSNAAEWLSMDDDLLSIKTRTARNFELNKIIDPEKKNSVILFAQVLNIALIPLLVIAFGIYRMLIRKKRQAVQSNHSNIQDHQGKEA